MDGILECECMKPFPSGLGVALVTPFTDSGAIDFPALDALVEHVVAGGVDYLVALGTTAETPALFPQERQAVLRRIGERNAGRVPLVAGIGGNNTAAVVAALHDFDLAGVDAVLSVTPYYNRPSQRGLYEHFRAVADASPVPVILYNVPGRTGVNMLPQTTLKLAREADNILAVKEASGDLEQIEELIAGRPEGFRILSGDDALAVSLIEKGGDGLVSVVANAYPSYVAAMVSAAMVQDSFRAHELRDRTEELVKALFAEGNPTGIKAALSLKGLLENNLRLPLIPSSPELTERIRSLSGRAGL